MKKIPALLGSVAFLVTDVAVHAVGAAEGPAPQTPQKSHLAPPGCSIPGLRSHFSSPLRAVFCFRC
jgi:hypothetical protein